MPRRWISLRGRHSNENSAATNDKPSGKPNPDVDLHTFSPHAPSFVPLERPSTSGGLDTWRKKKLQTDEPAIRPQTSHANGPPTGSFAQEDLVGVAYGSPSHPPPVTSRTLTAPKGLDSSDQQPLSKDGSIQHHQRRILPRPWKKIGALLTPKHPCQKATEQPNLHQPANEQLPACKNDEVQPKQRLFKYKVHIREAPPTRQPVQPPERGHNIAQQEAHAQQTEGKGISNTKENRMVVQQHTRLSELPKLEISIPNKPQSSGGTRVNAGDAATTSTSSLRERRRSRLNSGSGDSNIMSKADNKPATEISANTDKSNLLATDLSPPKADFLLKPSNSSPTLRKYSLFPPTLPSAEKISGPIQPAHQLKRSLTSPAQISPRQSDFPTSKARSPGDTTKPSADQDITSPDLNTASTATTTAWSSAIPSQKSSLSSNADEIFFDVKSFRDSSGVADGEHFVMSRPDSAAVELVRSMSKLKSAASKEAANKSTTLDDKAESSADGVRPAVSDDPPAVVERKPGEKLATSVVKTEISKIDLDLKVPPPELTTLIHNKGRADPTSTKVTIPSPIVEERSPGLAISFGSDESEKPMTGSESSSCIAPSPLRQEIHLPAQAQVKEKEIQQSSRSLQARTPTVVSKISATTASGIADASAPQLCKALPLPVKAIRRIDHPIQESPTIPQSPPPRTFSPENQPPPPPVPQKDNKFIPISKFASRKTLSKIESVGFRPAKVDRAATDSSLSRTDPLPTSARFGKGVRVERSASIPASRVGSNLRIESRRDRKGIPFKAAPAAEVSVAKAVSLTRQQSLKVAVPSPKVGGSRKQRRSDGDGEDEDKEKNDDYDKWKHGPSIATPTLITISPSGRSTSTSVPGGVKTKKPLSNLNPLSSHPMDSQASLVSQASQVSHFSYESEVSTISRAQEKSEREPIQKFKTRDQGAKEVHEGMLMSPVVVVEGLMGHKPGASVGVVLDTA